MKSILHKDFHYVPAHDTDIRKTFRRIERDRKAKADLEARNAAEREVKVAKIGRTK